MQSDSSGHQPIWPVILSGGTGSRLWPLSRTTRPKQLLALTGDDTMIVETARRVANRADFLAPLIVTGAAHAPLIREQLGPEPRLIVEPAPRNTAPAIALATLIAAASDPEAILLVMPSDHKVAYPALLQSAILAALPAVRAGWLLTFGIRATTPETGYGYIRAGSAIDGRVLAAAAFIEKPDRARALRLVNDGEHFWNSGIFLFSAATMRAALLAHAPGVLLAAEAALAGATEQSGMIMPSATAFAEAPAISIDHAVFELAGNIAVCPVDPGWSDIGSWDALHDLGDTDDHGNVLSGHVEAIDVQSCLLRADGITLAVIGVNNINIVATPDAVLVTARGRSQDVRAIASRLAGSPALDRPVIQQHPWGEERIIHDGAGVAVRKAVLNGRESLSIAAADRVMLLSGCAHGAGAAMVIGKAATGIQMINGDAGSVLLIFAAGDGISTSAQ